MVSQDLSQDKSKKKFSEGECVSLGLKGLYRVDHLSEMNLGDSKSTCYVLLQLFSKTIHKTFLPTNSIGNARATIRKEDLDFEGFFSKERITPIDYSLNSNKKILFYEDVIKKMGFFGVVESYLAVKEDRKQNTRSDKRYEAFEHRLLVLIIQEVALSMDIQQEDAKNIFETALKKYSNQ